ncbi:MAG: hypothetical protein ACXWAX_10185 [Chthoniobacterales bacterium]
MTPSRRILSALLVVAFALAAGLSAAPQLHEWLHNIGNQPTHECAATLMSSGSVEHSACEPVFVPPKPAPSKPAYRPQPFPRVLASFEFARLEHAPPASR